ncbi:MAG: GIY-YIG nuclease family protein [Planctomycetales bacterium]
MDKQQILDEIRRTAEANGGVALGRQRFEAETGIQFHEWYGTLWRNWGEAVAEAGYTPNRFNEAYDEGYLIEKYVELVRELGRMPVEAELRMKAHSDESFPSAQVIGKRLGRKAERMYKIFEYCRRHEGLGDIAEICAPIVAALTESIEMNPASDVGDETIGFVYLMKSGRFYKIGRTNSAGRREYELAIQLPEKSAIVHQIKTDDPVGIERYWHERFSEKRKNGEWFELTAADVRAFKKRRFM